MEKSNDLDLDVKVAEFLNSRLNLYSTLEIGQSGHNGNSIAYVMRPLDKYTRYYNRRIKRTFAFDIQAKNSNWKTTINTLNQINMLMDESPRAFIKSANGSFMFIKSEMTHAPNFVATVTDDVERSDGSNEYAVYQASFEVTAVLN